MNQNPEDSKLRKRGTAGDAAAAALRDQQLSLPAPRAMLSLRSSRFPDDEWVKIMARFMISREADRKVLTVGGGPQIDCGV
jgi:hypothetical protein